LCQFIDKIAPALFGGFIAAAGGIAVAFLSDWLVRVMLRRFVAAKEGKANWD
jgi:hypothetical protein